MIMTTSSIDDLIRNNNPFAGHTVVRPPQIWGKGFPDVPSINSHASDAVLEAVKLVRQGLRQTVGITIRGEKGLGKTQIVSRIRHRLQADNNTLFIYISKYDNLNQINYHFLQNIVSSLRAFGSRQGVMQWQELATALINDAKNWQHTPEQYINAFPSWLNKYSSKIVDHLTDNVLQVKPDIHNPYLVKAILWTLFQPYSIYATHWLSGLELAENQAEAMGLPNPKSQDKEAEALTTARQIIDITSDYKIPVICFDELDELKADENGWTIAMVIASLAKDLSNNLKRCVLFLAMYEETWKDQIKALPQAEAVLDRIANYPKQREPIDLKYLNSEDVVEVVSQWLKVFYEENQQSPPNRLYPFDENKLRSFGKQGKPTVRGILKWCSDNFLIFEKEPGKIEPDPVTVKHPVEPAFNNELANIDSSIDSFMEDEETIANALWLGFINLIGETIEGVEIEDIVEIEARAADQGYIDFKIVGKEKPQGKQNRKTVKIGVAVVQQSGTFLKAALSRLIDYQKFSLTRGCLVRSRQINPGANVAKEYARVLLKEKGGEWVKLESEHIKPLLAIQLVYENQESYELSEEQIEDFIALKKLAINNPIIREILSDPSGQEPDQLSPAGLPITIPKITPESSNEIELKV